MTFDFESPFCRLDRLEISLTGEHQVENAAVALMTVDVLRQYNALIAEPEDIAEALRRVRWPGRLEHIGENPGVLLDGAHNPEGAEALAKAIRKYFPHRRLHFMFGMMENKNHEGYLQHILPIADTIIVTEPEFRKKLSAADLSRKVRECAEALGKQVDIRVEPDWKKALDLLRSCTDREDLAVVSGTLYLVSDVRSQLLYGTDSEKGW